MCDYSLHHVKSRPARVGDKLTTRHFGTGTRGFAASEDASVAVCVLPGTELSFAEEVVCISLAGSLGTREDKSQDGDLPANQQGKGGRASRCAGISGRSDRAPNIPARRSAGNRASVTGGAKDCHCPKPSGVSPTRANRPNSIGPPLLAEWPFCPMPKPANACDYRLGPAWRCSPRPAGPRRPHHSWALMAVENAVKVVDVGIISGGLGELVRPGVNDRIAIDIVVAAT